MHNGYFLERDKVWGIFCSVFFPILLHFLLNVLPVSIRLFVSFRGFFFCINWKSTYCREYTSLLSFHIMPLYFRPHVISHFFSNILQFTTDQNLLIKKDIFGAAHFLMTCQPFWASCHLPSQHCGWGLIPSKLCELRAGERGRETEWETNLSGVSGEVGLRWDTWMDHTLLWRRSLNLLWAQSAVKLFLTTIWLCNTTQIPNYWRPTVLSFTKRTL